MFRLGASDAERAAADPLIKRVDAACSDLLISVDWSINMQLVDELNLVATREPGAVKEVIRAVRKKILSRNMRTVGCALHLAEALIKNCGKVVHAEAQGFLDAIASVAKKNSYETSTEKREIAEKALELIQSWGEAFLPMRRDLPMYVDVYHQLRKEGLPFAEQYQERPPVLEPVGPGTLLDQHSRSASQAQVPHAAAPTRMVVDVALGDTQAAELVASVESAAEMIRSMISAAESKEDIERYETLSDLVTYAKGLEPSMNELIERSLDREPDTLEKLLATKDSLEDALELYNAVLAGKAQVPLQRNDTSALQTQLKDLLIADDDHGKPLPPLALSRPSSKTKPPLVPRLNPPPMAPSKKIQKVSENNSFSNPSNGQPQRTSQPQSLDLGHHPKNDLSAELLSFAASLPIETSQGPAAAGAASNQNYASGIAGGATAMGDSYTEYGDPQALRQQEFTASSAKEHVQRALDSIGGNSCMTYASPPMQTDPINPFASMLQGATSRGAASSAAVDPFGSLATSSNAAPPEAAVDPFSSLATSGYASPSDSTADPFLVSSYMSPPSTQNNNTDSLI